MASQFRQYIIDCYEPLRGKPLKGEKPRSMPIQIDDQDDNDSFTNFCNIFCTVESAKSIKIELSGNIPITKSMAELALIYKGYADTNRGKLSIRITLDQIAVLGDLAQQIRKTALMGSLVNNPQWYRISARTASSLMRFYRVVEEFLLY
ncbi:MAG: hypothetical protein FWE57_10690 [Chitinispirillia bacterium]|nr:hypothetical protein [Chitinispirillia bacterium]